MATCRQIITTALRKIGVAGGEGKRTPSAEEAKDALEVLQAWYDAAMISGLFGRLEDVVIEDDYEAQEFERIKNNSEAEVDITLPATIADELTGDTRAPLDLAPVVVVDPATGSPQNYVYDSVVGNWVDLFGLTLDSEAPLSQRGRDGLACLLAVQIADEYGYAVGQVTMSRAARFVGSISQRSGSPRRAVDHEFF